MVPVLLLVGLFRNPRGWISASRTRVDDTPFFFWILISCVSVIALKPIAYAIYLFFLRLDFTHARVLIAALLPLAALVALALKELSPGAEGNHRIRYGALGFAAGAFGMLAIEVLASSFDSTISLAEWSDPPIQGPNVRVEALVRVGISIAALAVLLRMCSASSSQLRQVAHSAICASVISQCLIAADNQVNGPQTRYFDRPFQSGDFYYAKREEFELPSKKQLEVLHQRIEPQRYRVGLVCDKRIADGFCAGHVPEFWQLRSIDGYYGPGVPRRLRALPWPNGVSLRTISFTSLESVPWELLGFLNVRWMLSVDDGVFRNIVREGTRVAGRPDPSKFGIIASPARVTPRAFFAARVQPAASPEDAATKLFRPEGILDPEKTSFVEGSGRSQEFCRGGGDRTPGQWRFAAASLQPIVFGTLCCAE